MLTKKELSAPGRYPGIDVEACDLSGKTTAHLKYRPDFYRTAYMATKKIAILCGAIFARHPNYKSLKVTVKIEDLPTEHTFKVTRAAYGKYFGLTKKQTQNEAAIARELNRAGKAQRDCFAGFAKAFGN